MKETAAGGALLQLVAAQAQNGVSLGAAGFAQGPTLKTEMQILAI